MLKDIITTNTEQGQNQAAPPGVAGHYMSMLRFIQSVAAITFYFDDFQHCVVC